MNNIKQALETLPGNIDRIDKFVNSYGFYKTAGAYEIETLPSLSKRLVAQEKRLATLNETASSAVLFITESRSEVAKNRDDVKVLARQCDNSLTQATLAASDASVNADRAQMYASLGFGAGGSFDFGYLDADILIFGTDFGEI